jgi:hypothetical protein
MFPFELLSAFFFAALALAAVAMRRRRQAWLALIASAALLALIVLTSRTASAAIRAWAGHVYLVAAYRIPGLLATAASATPFEDWLVRTDREWRQYVPATPAWLAHVCELAYLLCYPLVPVSFLIVWTGGDDGYVNRFWMAVLGGGFVCYGLLPWLVSRPPRSLTGGGAQPRGVARLNALVLNHLSHRLNTFPSGHVAVSVASALSLWPISPAAAAIVGTVAGGVAAGAVTGRYHYVVDVLAGAVIGLLSASAAAFVT